MLQMSAALLYSLCPNSSGAAYAGLPHCVLQCISLPDSSNEISSLLRPKSVRSELL